MIYGMIFMSIISYYLNTYYTSRLIDYPLWEQFRDIFSYFIMAVLMGMAVYAAGLLPFPNHWSMLFVQVTIGIVIYVFLCWLFRLMAFMDIWQLSRGKLSFLRTET
jgi:hypothetical protein